MFNMTIDNLKVGKLNFKKSNVVPLIKKYVNSESLIHKLDLSGIKLSANLETLTISLDLLDIKGKLLNSIKESKEYGLYETLLGIIFRIDTLINLCDNSDNLGIDIDLASFCYDDEVDAEIPYKIDFDLVNAKIETLLNNKVIDEILSSDVATFITMGNRVEDQIKENIKNIDLSSIGIENKETYLGIIVYDDKTIEDSFVEQIPNLEDFGSFNGFKLEEKDWNNLFIQSNSVGQIYSFVREENDLLKSSYIGIESMYIDIKNNSYTLYLLISINGKSLVISLDMLAPSSEGLNIISSIDSINLGSNSLKDEEIIKILDFLSIVIEDEWINIDSSNKSIGFDFGYIFNNNQNLKSLINNATNIETTFVEKENIGYSLINLDFSL